MIPYFTVLYLFHLCIAFTGFTFGVADMGIQSLILKYWGNQGMDKRFSPFRSGRRKYQKSYPKKADQEV